MCWKSAQSCKDTTNNDPSLSQPSLQDPVCVQATTVKAESLYNLCKFEHSLKIFTQGRQLAPDSEKLHAGILKCRKTILDKLEHPDIFFFPGSHTFVDSLQKGGVAAVDNFLNDQTSEKYYRSSPSMTNTGKSSF